MVVFGASFIGLMLLPVDFPYWAFAALSALNGIGGGMFAAPNSASIMSSVPARYRGVASGMRSTYQNSGTALSIGVFFSLMIAGLAGTLGPTLTSGLRHQGVPAAVAAHIGGLPPVSTLFAAVLGLTGRRYFPGIISGPFHHGLTIVFAVAAGLAAIAALASLLRGGRPVDPGEAGGAQEPDRAQAAGSGSPRPRP
ncbi:MAG: hypothetical protein ACR2FU_07590 [Streptosporangiaceae bacterium]